MTEDCKHDWTGVRFSRFTGTPHRVCKVCGVIDLDVEADDTPEGERYPRESPLNYGGMGGYPVW